MTTNLEEDAGRLVAGARCPGGRGVDALGVGGLVVEPFDPATAAGTSEFKGQTYYFCSLGCKKSFDKEPEKYLSSTSEHEHHH